jgi:hypothetical protein
MHWRSLLPGRGRRTNHLTLGQRWGYLAGGLQWYGDLLGLLFYVFLLAGAVNLALGGGQLFRKLSVFLVAVVPVLVLLGLVRAIALLRRGTGASWRDALGAFFIWQSTSLVVARASIQGLVSRKAAFLRTPKTFDEAGWWQVIRANWAESGLAALGAIGIGVGLWRVDTLSGALLAALLVVPTLGFAAAPRNSLAAQQAALPADLTRRRRTEFLRQPGVPGTLAGATAVIGVGAAVVLVLMLAPTHGQLHTPRLVNPAPSHSGSTAPSSVPGGSGSTSGGSGASSSAGTSSGSGTSSSGGSSTAPSGTSTGSATSTPAGVAPTGSSSPAGRAPASSRSRAPASSTAPGSSSSAPAKTPKPTPTPTPKPTPTPTPSPSASG